MGYAALIRAHERTALLDQLIGDLRGQTAAPDKIIIVDSSPGRSAFNGIGGDDIEVVAYPDVEFNFSRAINLGLAHIESARTLIISSHIVLAEAGVIQRGLELAQQSGAEVLYWTGTLNDADRDGAMIIDRRNFSGTNGLFNSMSMVPTTLCRERPFREEVFSAEDQEWAAYYLRQRHGRILRITSRQVRYANPNHGVGTWSELKVFNEELALGYFVRRRFIYPDRILARALRGGVALLRGRGDRAKMHWRFAWAMTKANFVQPKAQSRYF